MSRHTKYMQEMLKKLDCGFNHVQSPDKCVDIYHDIEKVRGKILDTFTVYHYGTLILTIASDDSLRKIGKNGWSFTIGAGAYSPTDARIIQQVLEKYVPGFIAHSRKAEVIVD